MRKRTIITITTVAALAAGGTAIAAGARDDDATERPISGDALSKAKAAAADTPGRVTGTEVGDEESYYEVEVTRPDGSQVDVQLDREFRVVSSATDDENED